MDKYWFKAKEYGWGTGFPIAWQGWVALFVLVALISTAGFADGIFTKTASLKSWFRYFIDIFVFTVLFYLLFDKRVEGGIKWRWGKDKPLK